MSTAWNEGYFTDVGYTYGYYREINPVFQRFCLLARGFAVPEPDAAGARHAELGFGQGVSAAIHAAAVPGQYWGTDFNPAHAAHAQALAAASGSGAQLYDDSFEQLLARGDLPQFDSISLHGIWTWVSRANHHVIVEFARRHLRPGGVFYLSYNCFPGWSPAYPLRQLFALHDRFGAVPGDAPTRVGAALKFTQDLLAANPAYARAVPGLPARLEAIAKQDRHYLAHEYFNREWNCMYFTDVADALDPAKLDFAASAVPLDGVDAVNLAAEARAFLGTIAHPLLQEQVRDYFVGQQFRKDLYLRGATRLSPVERARRLLEARVALLQAPADVALTIKGGAGEVTLLESVYRPLLEALAERQYAPRSLRELAAALPSIQLGQVIEAATVLVHTGALAPAQPEAATQQVRKRTAALNAHLLQRAHEGGQAISVLASPVTGGGVPAGRFEQLFLHARAQGHKLPQDWAQHAWSTLQAQGQRLLKDGKAIESDEDNLAELQTQAAALADKRLPILKALQVV